MSDNKERVRVIGSTLVIKTGNEEVCLLPAGVIGAKLKDEFITMLLITGERDFRFKDPVLRDVSWCVVTKWLHSFCEPVIEKNAVSHELVEVPLNPAFPVVTRVGKDCIIVEYKDENVNPVPPEPITEKTYILNPNTSDEEKINTLNYLASTCIADSENTLYQNIPIIRAELHNLIITGKVKSPNELFEAFKLSIKNQIDCFYDSKLNGSLLKKVWDYIFVEVSNEIPVTNPATENKNILDGLGLHFGIPVDPSHVHTLDLDVPEKYKWKPPVIDNTRGGIPAYTHTINLCGFGDLPCSLSFLKKVNENQSVPSAGDNGGSPASKNTDHVDEMFQAFHSFMGKINPSMFTRPFDLNKEYWDMGIKLVKSINSQVIVNPFIFKDDIVNALRKLGFSDPFIISAGDEILKLIREIFELKYDDSNKSVSDEVKSKILDIVKTMAL